MCDSTSFAFNIDQICHILITCDNTYIMKSKDELVFVDFFFHLISLCYLRLILHVTCSS